MAGKIVADQLEHSTAGSLDTQYVVNGSAKSFFDLDATGTFSLKDSFNVASATDQATGTFDINYTNAFSSANNVPVNHTLNITNYDNTLTASKTASLVQVLGINSTNGTVQDTDPFGATHGDLA